jgi:hypothetical protein
MFFNLNSHATTLLHEKDEVRIRAFGSTSHFTSNASFATSRSARIRVFTLLLASRQSPWMIYFNESHKARKPLVFSLMRHSPHKNKRVHSSRNASISLWMSHLFLRDSLLTHKKSTTPGNLMSETVPACASRGSNPAHPESHRAFYINLLRLILCYKNARNAFVYRALRAIWNFLIISNKV